MLRLARFFRVLGVQSPYGTAWQDPQILPMKEGILRYLLMRDVRSKLFIHPIPVGNFYRKMPLDTGLLAHLPGITNGLLEMNKRPV